MLSTSPSLLGGTTERDNETEEISMSPKDPPMLPKKDEAVLIEIMRNLSTDIKAIGENLITLNAYLEACDSPEERRKVLDILVKMNNMLVKNNKEMFEKYLEWAIRLLTLVVAGLGLLKVSGVI
jgi:hypothetical protein